MPTVPDNGQRPPRKLLPAVVARLLARKFRVRKGSEDAPCFQERPRGRARRDPQTRGPNPATRSFTVRETSTSEAPAMPPIRAPMLTAIPPTFPAIVSTSPVWRPTRISIPSGFTASTAAWAQRTARAGPSKEAKNPSPAVSTSLPR